MKENTYPRIASLAEIRGILGIANLNTGHKSR
jgi:hypothetical protein